MTARHDMVAARADAGRYYAALEAALICMESGEYVKALRVVRGAVRPPIGQADDAANAVAQAE